jgi:hypothetical protein
MYDLGGMGVVILEGAWGVLNESAGQQGGKGYVTLHHRLLRGVQRLTADKYREAIESDTTISTLLPYTPSQTLPLHLTPNADTNERINTISEQGDSDTVTETESPLLEILHTSPVHPNISQNEPVCLHIYVYICYYLCIYVYV